MSLGIALVEASGWLGIERREGVLPGAVVLHRSKLALSVQVGMVLFLIGEVVLTFDR